MSVIKLNGKAYGGNVINFVNGVYVNPDNLIVPETNFTSSMSYTAIQDCIICMYLVCLGNASTYIKIDNKTVQNYWQSQMVTTSSAPIYIKKGQTLTVSGVHGDYDSFYWVYGVQTGSVSNAQHNYSTSEQVIGTWIDGKPLYQKTWDLGQDITVGAWTSVMSVADVNIDVLVNSISVQNSKSVSLIEYWVDGTTLKGNTLRPNSASDYVRYLTLQYTKTTD